MPINIQNISELTQDQVNAAYNIVVQMVQEQNPSIDVKRGAIKDLVMMLSSIPTAMNQANMDRVRQANSLLAINQDPTLADNDIVNAAVSNFNTARIMGTASSGYITIVMNVAKSIIIPKGTQFATNAGLTFFADNTYTSKVNQIDVVTGTDKLLIQTDTDKYVFNVGVVSSATGSQYKVNLDTTFIVPPIDPAVIQAYASNDFIGGTNDETNVALMARLQSSVASKTMSNRPGITGLIRAVELPSYDSSFATSIVGYGDAEQQRYHTIFPVAFGGRVDVYVRTQATIQSVELFKNATYVGNDTHGNGKWQLTFTRDEAPGFYEIDRVTLPANINNNGISSFSIISDVRNFDLSVGDTAGLIYLPDIAKSLEASYTRYQVANVIFTDTTTSSIGLTANVSTALYGLQLSMLPGLAVIQDVVSDRNSSSPVSDCLIKAPIPCSVSVNVTIAKTPLSVLSNIVAIQQAVVDVVNDIGFTGSLPASAVITAIHNLINTAGSITSITLSGSIRRPDGVIVNLSSSTLLSIPNDPTHYVTPNTVGFFTTSSNVQITVA